MRAFPEEDDRECRGRLIREVAEEQDILISTAESIIGHYTKYIADVIRAGSMEGVFVPYLGKFQVKLEYQQYRAYLHSLHPVMKKLFQQTAPEEVNQLLNHTHVRGKIKFNGPTD